MKRTSKEILAIVRPEHLFNSPDSIDTEFRSLAKVWHPDVCNDKDAVAVFTHIKHLKETASQRTRDGHWGFKGKFEVAGTPYLYHTTYEQDVCECFITADAVIYKLRPEFLKDRLITTGYSRAPSMFLFPDDRLRREISKCLPIVVNTIERGTFSIPRPPTMILLRDVLSYYNGSLDVKDVAWILSGLHNLLCYFSICKIYHGDISLDTYFIDPENHTGALLGGWWYCSKIGETIKILPSRTYKNLPFTARMKKTAQHSIDSTLIKVIGKELLGGALVDVPSPFKEWLKAPAGTSPIENYKQWQKILVESFGKRRFNHMEIKHTDVY